MKKLLIMVAVGMLAIPLLNVEGQTSSNSSGLSLAYTDIERANVTQVQKAFSVYEKAYKEQNEQMKKQKELEIDVEIYALKYKNADNTNQQKIKSDLQTALNQLFDICES